MDRAWRDGGGGRRRRRWRWRGSQKPETVTNCNGIQLRTTFPEAVETKMRSSQSGRRLQKQDGEFRHSGRRQFLRKAPAKRPRRLGSSERERGTTFARWPARHARQTALAGRNLIIAGGLFHTLSPRLLDLGLVICAREVALLDKKRSPCLCSRPKVN